MRGRTETTTLIAAGLLVTASVFLSDACAQSVHYPRNVESHRRHPVSRHEGYRFHAGIGAGFLFPGYPWLGGPYVGFPSFSYSIYAPGYYGAYGVEYNSALNQANYWLPPVYAPAELMYGPQANNRFWGIETPVAPAPVADAAGSELLRRAITAAEVATNLRKSNNVARERGQKFLDFGDALFREQRFHEALQRYKSAAEAAPDLASAYFRQGHALIAVNQLALAAKAFKIAAHLDPETARRGFDVNLLYADGGIVKASHLEALAEQALASGSNADLLFLVGVFLHNDGQGERAKKFFRKASESTSDDTSHLAPYLHDAAAVKESPPHVSGRDT